MVGRHPSAAPAPQPEHRCSRPATRVETMRYVAMGVAIAVFVAPLHRPGRAAPAPARPGRNTTTTHPSLRADWDSPRQRQFIAARGGASAYGSGSPPRRAIRIDEPPVLLDMHGLRATREIGSGQIVRRRRGLRHRHATTGSAQRTARGLPQQRLGPDCMRQTVLDNLRALGYLSTREDLSMGGPLLGNMGAVLGPSLRPSTVASPAPPHIERPSPDQAPTRRWRPIAG